MAMMPEKVPCLMYSLVFIITQVQVNPRDQGAVYIERVIVSSMCSLPIALRSDYCQVYTLQYPTLFFLNWRLLDVLSHTIPMTMNMKSISSGGHHSLQLALVS